MRGGLVGDDIGNDAACVERRQKLGRVAAEPERQSALFALRGANRGERRIQRMCFGIEVAVGDAPVDPRLVDVDAEDHSFGHLAGERLCAAHAAQSRRQDEAPEKAAAEMPLGDPHENLIGALNDALRADVLPVTGGQAAPADQVALFEFVERLRLGPLSDHVAIRHDHDGRFGMRLQDADGLA